ncbi:MAG: sulfur oxidation c-type cytochrome SoxX [Rhodomicrobium sp.]|nr:sulfur oxidation c-type cytochrome SoxX [Rhodomicrobium sp.]
MTSLRIALTAAAALALTGSALAEDIKPADEALVEKYVAATWTKAPEDWKGRIKQDETQRICSQYKNQPPGEIADKILEREKATVVYPADGNVMGDWKEGEKIAQSGFGGRFNDKADTVNGGNCYACHQMRPDELSYGTLGPSLLGYGKTRNFDPAEAKAAYAKVYNPQAVLPCSQMPRFGYHSFLSEKQIKDVVALLFAKDSPVNK